MYTPIRKLVTAVVLGAFIIAPLSPVVAAPPSPPPSQNAIQKSFKQATDLMHQTTLGGGEKNSFIQKLDAALRSHNRGHACTAVNQLGAFLNSAEALRKQNQSVGELLFATGWQLRSDILISIGPGGGCRGFSAATGEPQVSIGTSTNKGMTLDVIFPDPVLSPVVGNNETFTRVSYPGIEYMIGEPGEPGVPEWHTLIGIPQGATASLVHHAPVAGSEITLNLVPFQQQPVDQNHLSENDGLMGSTTDNTNAPGDTLPEPPPEVFADKPFVKNLGTYATNAFLPPNPCNITPMGKYRDLEIVQLTCSTGQYNPTSNILKTYNSVHVEVQYKGGSGNFITSQAVGPFESTAYTEGVVNKDIIKNHVAAIDLSNLQCTGEELLILTHPDFKAASDNLATWKQEKGIVTNVFTVGAGTTRDTAKKIDQFIEDRYDKCKVRPSYVLLMGDAEFIPTFYPYTADTYDNAGSDFPYSNYVQILFDAFFPDFGVGRIPVDTNDQAQTVVDKIVSYEKTPPNLGIGSGGPFYTTAGLAAQFQCCQMNQNGTAASGMQGTDQRAFIETSELIRTSLVSSGYSVPRLYTRTVDGGGYCLVDPGAGNPCPTNKVQQAYSSDSTPRRYFNGTLLPSAIGGSSGFAWTSDTTDVVDDWNEGRFLYIHRDHGWPGGWGDPGFSTGNIPSLTNGNLLPVVLSINCASGMFDNETASGMYGTTMNGVYFAEQLLRKADGGAIGIIGDTRNSPTWANNALTRGFMDAMFPNTVSSFGSATPRKRLGDVVNWGKIYLATQVGVEQTAGDVTTDQMGYEYHIWGLTGDPTLEMWTKNPYKFVLPTNITLLTENNRVHVGYPTDGATITVLQSIGTSTLPVGRAKVINGVAEVELFEIPNPQFPLAYSASMDDAVSTRVYQETDQTQTTIQ